MVLAGMAAVSAGVVKFFWQGHYKFLKHLQPFLASTQDINPEHDGDPHPFDTNISHISETQDDKIDQADTTHISETQQHDKNQNNSGL